MPTIPEIAAIRQASMGGLYRRQEEGAPPPPSPQETQSIPDSDVELPTGTTPTATVPTRSPTRSNTEESSNSTETPLSSSTAKKEFAKVQLTQTILISLVAALALIVIVMAIVFGFFWRKQRNRQKQKDLEHLRRQTRLNSARSRRSEKAASLKQATDSPIHSISSTTHYFSPPMPSYHPESSIMSPHSTVSPIYPSTISAMPKKLPPLPSPYSHQESVELPATVSPRAKARNLEIKVIPNKPPSSLHSALNSPKKPRTPTSGTGKAWNAMERVVEEAERRKSSIKTNSGGSIGSLNSAPGGNGNNNSGTGTSIKSNINSSPNVSRHDRTNTFGNKASFEDKIGPTMRSLKPSPMPDSFLVSPLNTDRLAPPAPTTPRTVPSSPTTNNHSSKRSIVSRKHSRTLSSGTTMSTKTSKSEKRLTGCSSIVDGGRGNIIDRERHESQLTLNARALLSTASLRSHAGSDNHNSGGGFYIDNTGHIRQYESPPSTAGLSFTGNNTFPSSKLSKSHSVGSNLRSSSSNNNSSTQQQMRSPPFRIQHHVAAAAAVNAPSTISSGSSSPPTSIEEAPPPSYGMHHEGVSKRPSDYELGGGSGMHRFAMI